MTIEAYEKWQKYAKSVEGWMGETGHLSHITDWAGKLPGSIARIAALLHIMRYSHQSPYQHLISLEDMTSAIKIGHVLTHHALAVFDLLQQEHAMQVAKVVYQWVKHENIKQFTRRECQRKFRRYKKEDLQPGLEILKEYEIIRNIEAKQDKGRP